MKEFLEDSSLSGDATENELTFLRTLSDPLHFRHSGKPTLDLLTNDAGVPCLSRKHVCQDERDDPGYDIETQVQFCAATIPSEHGFLLYNSMTCCHFSALYECTA